jgi:hypothetical protein
MRREPLIEVGDLLAQIFLLELEQRFGIALLHAGNEQREKAFDEIPKSAEHAPLRSRTPAAPAVALLVWRESVAKIAAAE